MVLRCCARLRTKDQAKSSLSPQAFCGHGVLRDKLSCVLPLPLTASSRLPSRSSLLGAQSESWLGSLSILPAFFQAISRPVAPKSCLLISRPRQSTCVPQGSISERTWHHLPSAQAKSLETSTALCLPNCLPKSTDSTSPDLPAVSAGLQHRRPGLLQPAHTQQWRL